MSFFRWVLLVILLAGPASASTVTFEFNSGVMRADPNNGLRFQNSLHWRPTVTVDQSYLTGGLASSTLFLRFGGDDGSVIYEHRTLDGTQSGRTPVNRTRLGILNRGALPPSPFQTSLQGVVETVARMTFSRSGRVTAFQFSYVDDCMSAGISSNQRSYAACYDGPQMWRSARNGNAYAIAGAVPSTVPLPAGLALLLSAIGIGFLARRRTT